MYQLKIINSTTRIGRRGGALEKWVTEYVRQQEDFNVEFLDLSEINLPFMDEPNHPRLKKYQQEHTKKWSAKIDEADAFIIVLAEYNYSIPAPIKNAIDYLFNEWKYKPLGIVSYGGVSGGLRSSQMLKQVVTTVSMMPLSEQVNIPFFTEYINDEEQFIPNDTIKGSMDRMLVELLKWTASLKSMRDNS